MKKQWLLIGLLAFLTFDLVVIAAIDVVATGNITEHISDSAKTAANSSDKHDTHSNDSSTSNHTNVDPCHTEEGQGQDEDESSHHSDKIHVVEINFKHVKIPLLVGVVIIIAGLSKIGFHHANFLASKVPESCILIILGVICGSIVYVSGAEKSINFFEPHVFFLYLLPPIILEAAFSLHDRTFTDNLGSILMFSVVGTVIACFAMGLTLFGLQKAGAMAGTGANLVQILVFSALIVAVDPVAVLAIFQEVGVNNMLYFMVFGESLLNDGVTVVLYNVMQTYNRMETIEADQIVLGIVKFMVVVIGGLLVGLIHGIISSFITKFTNSVKVVEPIIIFGFAYQSYILAELFHFSGIISIIACGLVQMQYAFNNITNKSKLACKFFAKVISNTCEIIIFLFLGLKTVHPRHSWNTGFVLWTLFFCILYRFIITFGIAMLINRCDKYRVRKIKLDEMFMISYGGLRGAVCFSLVALLDEKEFPMKDLFLTTTLFIIFFTVFIQGGTIKWLVKKLRVTLQDSSKDMIMYQELNHHISDHLMAGIEEIVGVSGKNKLREKFDRVDDKFIRPVLLRDAKKCDTDEINQYYEKLMMKEHYKNLQLCGVSNLPHVPTSLREVDSSACLKVMDDVYEQEALERDEKVMEKRQRLTSQRSLRGAEGPEGELDLQKVFRDALANSLNKGGLHFHDKNFTGDERRHMVGHLRHKHRKNRALSVLNPPRLERALSWNPNEGDLAIRRTSDLNLEKRAARAQTVDLSPQDLGPMSPGFGAEDTVFEVPDEEETETDPLILHMNNNLESQLHKRVTFGNPTNSVSEETSADVPKPSNTAAITTEDETDGVQMRSPHRTVSSDSHHCGQLLRQNAVINRDSEVVVELQDLGDKSSNKQPTRQKSV